MKKTKLFLLCSMFALSIFGTNEIVIKKDSFVLKHLDSLKYYLDKFKVKEPLFVMSQALWESGNFKCKNCAWENNNIFGFMGSNGKYMKFSTFEECVKYYANWQKIRYGAYKKRFPKGDYYGFLKWSHYAACEDYNSKVRMMYNWIQANWVKT